MLIHENKEDLIMRKALALVLCGAMAVSMVGCGSSNSGKKTSDETSKKSVKLSVTTTYAGEDTNAQNYKDAVAAWESKTGNKVDDSSATSDETFKSRITTDFETGSEPDVLFFFNGVDSNQFVEQGKVVSVDEIRKEYPDYASNMKDDMLGASPVDGKNYSIPVNGFWEGMFVNKEVLKKAGVDVPTKDTTWDEFLECCEKLKSSGITPLGMGLKDGYLPAWIGIFLGQQNMDSVNDMISLMSGQESFTDKKYSEWLEKIAELKEAGYINEDILSLDLYQGQQLIESKKAAMTLHTQPYAVSLEKSLGSDQIGFAKAPVFGTGKFADSVATPSQVYVIPNSAKHKEEAADFLLFLQEEDNIKYLYESANAMMPNNNFDESWVSSEIDRKVLEWQKEDNNFCYQLYFAPMFETDGLIPTVQKMFSEGLAPKDAAVELDEALGKCMEQNPEVHDAFLEWSVEE